MSVERYASAVRDRIAALFGNTSDLSEELVNSLANVYYFCEKAQKQTLGGLSDLLEIHPGKSKEELVPMYLSFMPHLISSAEHLPELVRSLRASRADGGDAFALLEQLTLDLIKYRIEGAEGKSGLRRSLERKVKTPTEHRDLARRFQVPFRSSPQ